MTGEQLNSAIKARGPDVWFEEFYKTNERWVESYIDQLLTDWGCIDHAFYKSELKDDAFFDLSIEIKKYFEGTREKGISYPCAYIRRISHHHVYDHIIRGKCGVLPDGLCVYLEDITRLLSKDDSDEAGEDFNRLLSDEGAGADQIYFETEFIPSITRAINSLSDDPRQIIMDWIQYEKHFEIAKIRGISIATSRVNRYCAKDALYAALREFGINK